MPAAMEIDRGSCAIGVERRLAGVRASGVSYFSKLEANASAQFDLPIAARLLLRRSVVQSAEAGRAFEESRLGIDERVLPLVMVQDVGEHALKLQTDALRHPEVLLDTEVHIPVGQAIDNACSAVPIIQPEDRITEAVNRCRAVGK